MRTPFAILLLAGVAFSQAATPSFEVASLKHLAPGTAAAGGGRGAAPASSPRTVNYTSITLKELIRRAWKVTDSQVHGPAWMAEEHYSLIAKMPDGTNQGDIPAMLQPLLTERLHLVLHHEQSPLAVYALVPAKGGLKIKENSDAALRELSDKDPRLASRLADMGPGSMITSVGKGHLVCKQVTMARLANFLVRYLDRPVVDQTEKTGEYSFVLDWLYEPPPGFPESALPPPEERVGLPLAGALTAQLGLQLEKRNTLADMLMIDTIDRIPIDN